MLHDQAGADLEEGLTVAIGQLVQDRAPGRIRERLEDVAHAPMIGKYHLHVKPAGHPGLRQDR